MLRDIGLIIGGHDAHGCPFYQPWFHGWFYSMKIQLFNHEHLCVFVNENHPLKIHKQDCTDVHMWNLDDLHPQKKKHCEWTTFHGRNEIYMIFLGTLFHSKISWIFMDGLLFHQKGFDSKDVLKGILNFERLFWSFKKPYGKKRKKLR